LNEGEKKKKTKKGTEKDDANGKNRGEKNCRSGKWKKKFPKHAAFAGGRGLRKDLRQVLNWGVGAL